MDATRLWSLWQALLRPFRHAFTAPGWRRFVEWITGLALNAEEHTVTQSLLALDRPDDWKALESFVEYGHWDHQVVATALAGAVDAAPGGRWHGYCVSAIDDTKVHRSSPDVWGTCTFHEYTARCPNRATTVRAHNWVVLGRLLAQPRADTDGPAGYVHQDGRLYFRKSQLPRTPVPEVFRTKCELAVALARHQATAVAGRHLAVFDGGFAFRSVVRPLVDPDPGHPVVEFITRLRHDARLCRRPDPPPPGRRGRPPVWGRPLPPPRQGGRWPGPWHDGTAYLYGRRRAVRWKEVVCLWRVLGHDRPVTAVVAAVEGYRKRFTLVSSAGSLSGLQVVELFAARFRQEDGFRDAKQRLGWEECRAWTKAPIERTTQAIFITMAVWRLLQWRLTAAGETDWWRAPPWDRTKARPSLLDVQRLFRCHAGEFRACVSAWLGNEGNSGVGGEAG